MDTWEQNIPMTLSLQGYLGLFKTYQNVTFLYPNQVVMHYRWSKGLKILSMSQPWCYYWSEYAASYWTLLISIVYLCLLCFWRKIGPLVLGSFGKYMKSGRFHGKDLYTLHIQWICIGSDEKYSIKWISPWNPADFMHEIWWISCMKFSRFHAWNLADFMKSGRFQALKFGGFHVWNLADFICKLPHLHMKSGRFHEIWQISWWNLADFIHEIRRISWLILKNANFFYNTYNFFFYVNQISNSLAMVAPDWVYDRVQYRASKFNDRDRTAILRFRAKWLPVKKYMWFQLNFSCASIGVIMWYICKI